MYLFPPLFLSNRVPSRFEFQFLHSTGSTTFITTHRGICLQNHFIPLVSPHLGQTGCQKMRKTSRNSNFLVWCAVFQSKVKNLQKRPKLNEKHEKNAILGRFFEICAILTEKQSTKPKNLSSLKFSTSSDTLFAPNGARLVE